MADEPRKLEQKSGKSPREERLAAALRENLRRRKAQARARHAAERHEAKTEPGRDG